jgi:hypothetical protein
VQCGIFAAFPIFLLFISILNNDCFGGFPIWHKGSMSKLGLENLRQTDGFLAILYRDSAISIEYYSGAHLTSWGFSVGFWHLTQLQCTHDKNMQHIATLILFASDRFPRRETPELIGQRR